MEFGVINSMSFPELIAALVVGIFALVVGLRKLHTMYATSEVSIARVNSEIDVITLLREQIQDLARANKDLRAEIEELRKLNSSLVVENDSIKRELRLLRNEINAMRQCSHCSGGHQSKAPASHDGPDLP